MPKIIISDFAISRHFNPTFGGTKILDMIPDQVEFQINSLAPVADADGYAPFCKHFFFENFSEALDGVAEITPENQGLLQSGYEARTPAELPVLSRWFSRKDVPVGKAQYLDMVVYSREHCVTKEGMEVPEGVEWVVVSINSAPTPEESPMPPATMVRNALGTSEGGSGVPLNRDAYLASVAYWSKWAIVR